SRCGAGSTAAATCVCRATPTSCAPRSPTTSACAGWIGEASPPASRSRRASSRTSTLTALLTTRVCPQTARVAIIRRLAGHRRSCAGRVRRPSPRVRGRARAHRPPGAAPRRGRAGYPRDLHRGVPRRRPRTGRAEAAIATETEGSMRLDRIAEPWGTRTPYGPGRPWPARVDTHLAEGTTEADVQHWVQTASILHSNGDALDIA